MFWSGGRAETTIHIVIWLISFSEWDDSHSNRCFDEWIPLPLRYSFQSADRSVSDRTGPLVESLLFRIIPRSSSETTAPPCAGACNYTLGVPSLVERPPRMLLMIHRTAPRSHGKISKFSGETGRFTGDSQKIYITWGFLEKDDGHWSFYFWLT